VVSSPLLSAIGVLFSLMTAQAPGPRPAAVIPDECPRVLLTYTANTTPDRRSRGQSLIAVDVGEYLLELRRDGDRLGHGETAAEPGDPLPVPLAAIRQGAFDLALDGVVRVRGRLDEGQWQCPATIWKD
jgi:hypothetical protein